MTELTDFQEKIAALLPDVELKFDEPLAKHTSLRIGGGAEVMAFPKNAEELAEILKVSVLLDGSFAILGAGTNVLAPDEGVRGLVICLKDCLEGVEPLPGNRLRVMAGVTMSRAAVAAGKPGSFRPGIRPWHSRHRWRWGLYERRGLRRGNPSGLQTGGGHEPPGAAAGSHR